MAMAKKCNVFTSESSSPLDEGSVIVYVQRNPKEWDFHMISKIGYKWVHCGVDKISNSSLEMLLPHITPTCRRPYNHEIDIVKQFYKENPNF